MCVKLCFLHYVLYLLWKFWLVSVTFSVYSWLNLFHIIILVSCHQFDICIRWHTLDYNEMMITKLVHLHITYMFHRVHSYWAREDELFISLECPRSTVMRPATLMWDVSANNDCKGGSSVTWWCLMVWSYKLCDFHTEDCGSHAVSYQQ